MDVGHKETAYIRLITKEQAEMEGNIRYESVKSRMKGNITIKEAN